MRFYRLMIDYHQSTDNFLEISRAWHKIFHTKMVQEKQDLAEEVFLFVSSFFLPLFAF